MYFHRRETPTVKNPRLKNLNVSYNAYWRLPTMRDFDYSRMSIVFRHLLLIHIRLKNDVVYDRPVPTEVSLRTWCPSIDLWQHTQMSSGSPPRHWAARLARL